LAWMKYFGKSTFLNLVLVSTSNFRSAIELLTKRTDSGYANCIEDILNEFRGHSFEDIYNRHFLVREMGNVQVIKLRIQNSELGYSSAAGYRLIVLCNTNKNHIALLTIYPKKGKHSRGDITKFEYKELANTYAKELKSEYLREFARL
jgi:hypothetical protein